MSVSTAISASEGRGKPPVKARRTPIPTSISLLSLSSPHACHDSYRSLRVGYSATMPLATGSVTLGSEASNLIYVSWRSLPLTTLSSDVPRRATCECLRRLGEVRGRVSRCQGRRGKEGALVGFLPDVERELLEPVDRLGHLVHADDHAPRLDLGAALPKTCSPSQSRRPRERLGLTQRRAGTHRINASSNSSLPGCRSPIPAARTAVPAPPSPRTWLRYASCLARSMSRKSVLSPKRSTKRLTCGARRDWRDERCAERVPSATCVERSRAELRARMLGGQLERPHAAAEREGRQGRTGKRGASPPQQRSSRRPAAGQTCAARRSTSCRTRASTSPRPRRRRGPSPSPARPRHPLQAPRRRMRTP